MEQLWTRSLCLAIVQYKGSLGTQLGDLAIHPMTGHTETLMLWQMLTTAYYGWFTLKEVQ